MKTAPLWERKSDRMLIRWPRGGPRHLQLFFSGSKSNVFIVCRKPALPHAYRKKEKKTLQCISLRFPGNNHETWTNSKIIRIRMEAGGGRVHFGWPSYEVIDWASAWSSWEEEWDTGTSWLLLTDGKIALKDKRICWTLWAIKESVLYKAEKSYLGCNGFCLKFVGHIVASFAIGLMWHSFIIERCGVPLPNKGYCKNMTPPPHPPKSYIMKSLHPVFSTFLSHM